MRVVSTSIAITLSASVLLSSSLLLAEDQIITQWQEPVEESSKEPSIADLVPNDAEKPKAANTPFQSFAGRITRNKVRMRLQPNLDSPIVKEINRDELYVVDGEVDDFYSVRPPANLKGYVYRTYILDNVVEGSKVNVRLEPDLDAPVIAQLNGGTKVQGTISPLNSKWMEIPAPDTIHFYISKEYIEKKGPASLVEATARRKGEVANLFQQAFASTQAEMDKRYEDMNIGPVTTTLNTIIAQYSEFSEEAEKSRALLQKLQENYLQKKVAYLEAKQTTGAKGEKAIALQQLAEDVPAKSNIQRQLPTNYRGQPITDKMAQWLPVEDALYEAWAIENGHQAMDRYYQHQEQDALTLAGIIEPYNRNVKNRPGDYILLSQANRLPIAYLYSTDIDLQNSIGQAITIKVAPRTNNHFAYPAYFVLSIQ